MDKRPLAFIVISALGLGQSPYAGSVLAGEQVDDFEFAIVERGYKKAVSLEIDGHMIEPSLCVQERDAPHETE